MDRDRVISFLGEDWTAVNLLIRDALSSDISLLNATNENILSHAGKMLRPMLSLLVARMCGEVNADSRRVAAASELLHNATLLHDDVADESPERRGVPTVASILGGPASVLLGDFWLVKAVELILGCNQAPTLIGIFSKTLSDLAEGEMLQLQKASVGDTSDEDYFRIIYSKTASLFEASCVSAAVSVGASESLTEAARSYSTSLGIAFQIKDDIMDYEDSASIGKPTGVDLREQKITLPLLGALRNVSSERDHELREMVCEMSEHPERCEELRRFVIDAGGIEVARTSLEDYISKAKQALKAFPPSEARDMLEQLADYTAYRRI